MNIKKYKNKINFKAIGALAILVVAMILIIIACSKTEHKGVNEINPNAVEVFISIDYPTEANIPDMVNQKFNVEKSSNLFSTIQLYGNVYDVPIILETTKGELIGINGVNNGSYENGKWKVNVNKEDISESLQKVELKSGDKVQFYYQSQPSEPSQSQ